MELALFGFRQPVSERVRHHRADYARSGLVGTVLGRGFDPRRLHHACFYVCIRLFEFSQIARLPTSLLSGDLETGFN